MAYKQISPQSVSEGGTGASTLTGVLTGNGTSAITGNTVTQYGVLIGGASNAVSSTAVGTAGQVLTSNGAGSDPTYQDNASGDVSGPGSSTDNAVARWNGTSGDALLNSTPTITDNGEMVNISQPAFLGYLATSDLNSTGNGAVYTLGEGNALTAIFDQNSDFDVGGSGGSGQATFTSPVDGVYFLGTGIGTRLALGATNNELTLITSNRNYYSLSKDNTRTTSTQAGFRSFSTFVDMDASDTAYVTFEINGLGGNTVEIRGTIFVETKFFGFLSC
jgi:hypothetical protein